MKEVEAIETLWQVMMGEQKEKLPKNSVQEHRSVQDKEQARGRQVKEAVQPHIQNQTESTLAAARPKRVLSPVSVADIPEHIEAKSNDDAFSYISDNKDDDQP